MAESIESMGAQRKSGGVAAVLNLVLPGAGYIYCGRVLVGLCAFVLFAIVATVTVGFGLLLLVPIYVIDGFLAAKRANRAIDAAVEKATKTCPQCAERVQRAAVVCKHCAHRFG